jgi:hypothetical protein
MEHLGNQQHWPHTDTRSVPESSADDTCLAGSGENQQKTHGHPCHSDIGRYGEALYSLRMGRAGQKPMLRRDGVKQGLFDLRFDIGLVMAAGGVDERWGEGGLHFGHHKITVTQNGMTPHRGRLQRSAR